MSNGLYTFLSIAAFIILFITTISFIFLVTKLIIRLMKKGEFPKTSLLLTVIGGLLSFLFFYNHHNNLNFLPVGYLNEPTVLSQEGSMEIRTYHYLGMFSQMSRGEVLDKSSDKGKTIYFNDYDYNPKVEWINKNIVKIGRETLDLSKNEVYDFRKDPNKMNKKKLPPQA